jgi:hypothetical protein
VCMVSYIVVFCCAFEKKNELHNLCFVDWFCIKFGLESKVFAGSVFFVSPLSSSPQC